MRRICLNPDVKIVSNITQQNQVTKIYPSLRIQLIQEQGYNRLLYCHPKHQSKFLNLFSDRVRVWLLQVLFAHFRFPDGRLNGWLHPYYRNIIHIAKMGSGYTCCRVASKNQCFDTFLHKKEQLQVYTYDYFATFNAVRALPLSA